MTPRGDMTLFPATVTHTVEFLPNVLLKGNWVVPGRKRPDWSMNVGLSRTISIGSGSQCVGFGVNDLDDMQVGLLKSSRIASVKASYSCSRYSRNRKLLTGPSFNPAIESDTCDVGSIGFAVIHDTKHRVRCMYSSVEYLRWRRRKSSRRALNSLCGGSDVSRNFSLSMAIVGKLFGSGSSGP